MKKILFVISKFQYFSHFSLNTPFCTLRSLLRQQHLRQLEKLPQLMRLENPFAAAVAHGRNLLCWVRLLSRLIAVGSQHVTDDIKSVAQCMKPSAKAITEGADGIAQQARTQRFDEFILAERILLLEDFIDDLVLVHNSGQRLQILPDSINILLGPVGHFFIFGIFTWISIFLEIPGLHPCLLHRRFARGPISIFGILGIQLGDFEVQFLFHVVLGLKF